MKALFGVLSMSAVGVFVWWASSAFNWAELTVCGVIACFLVWLAWQSGHAEYGFEDATGYHRGHPPHDLGVAFDWYGDEDVSEVRHGGLGR